LPANRDAGNTTNSRIIIYAVRPYHWKEEFPKVNTVSRDYAAAVEKKWIGKLEFLKRSKR
jgi:hypothetical protein